MCRIAAEMIGAVILILSASPCFRGLGNCAEAQKAGLGSSGFCSGGNGRIHLALMLCF